MPRTDGAFSSIVRIWDVSDATSFAAWVVMSGQRRRALGGSGDAKTVLRSVVQPDAEVATGFESVVVSTVEGETIGGMLRPESEEAILIHTGEEGPVTLPKSRTRHREKAPSAMPGGLADLMTLVEMRDLIEALEE